MGSLKRTPILLLITQIITIFAITPTLSETHWEDIEALKQLKLSVSPSSIPPGSCLSSWDFSRDPCDSLFSPLFTCGFTCSSFFTPRRGKNASRITELALDQAGYSAPLSLTPFSSLPFLTSLDLSGNNFSGPIPLSLSSLPSLRRLSLSSNSLSGPLPGPLGALRSLQELLLDNNALSGPIPGSLSGLISLQRLELQGNKLTGEFPNLSQLTNLSFLDCSDNSLSGSFPSNLPPSVIELSMRGNNLEGNLPREGVKNLGFLQVLDLSNNRISGAVPSPYFTHPALQQLSLSNNNLTSIEAPANNPGAQSGLIAVDLSGNGLTGLLPVFLGLMPRLSALSLENNRFTGMIPTQYALKTALPQPGVAPFERLLLGGNYLFGPIPGPLMRLLPGSVNVNLVDNCLFVCPGDLFFCQGGDQKSMGECRDTIGPLIP